MKSGNYQAFGKMTIKILRDFILDNDVTENDSVIINKLDYDDVVSEYNHTFEVGLIEPYFLLGVLVRKDNGTPIQERFAIIEDDLVALLEKREKQLESEMVVYRCGYCGNVVGDKGEQLNTEELNKSESYLAKYGRSAKVERRHGYCCAPGYYEEKAKYPSYSESLHDIDYSFMEGKLLMDITEDDFERIGLYKSKASDREFAILYNCPNDHNTKIYFTPNENSYSLRGFLLVEEEIIFTTEDLIKAIKNWRKEKVLSYH